ncbi:MAG: NAD-dependent epimerase/dehydratase family protein [Elusimicrobia bacterium]|nr:NAD-dependent epimerase/dehydratase family protein [Elusimicrobiota bacterium]
MTFDLKAGVRVAVVGAGYLGERAARELQSRGCEVIATARTPVSVHRLTRQGFKAAKLDLVARTGFRAVKGVDAILLCAAPRRHSDADYLRLYKKGIAALCAKLRECGQAPRMVYTSSTAVYHFAHGHWTSERSPVDTSTPRRAALVAAEEAVRHPPLSGIVLRLGGIYGPGRNRVPEIRNGLLPVESRGNFANIIHVDDAVAAAFFLLQRGRAGQTYIGVDTRPVRRSEMYAWLAKEIGAPAPLELPASTSPLRSAENKRCSSAKLIKLGYHFIYPSFEEGYRAIIAEEAEARRRPIREAHGEGRDDSAG